MRQMTVSNVFTAGHGRQTLSAQAVATAASQGRHNAAKSLDLLRSNIQSLVNKDIDALLRKYLDKFFQPAILNIRKNLGDDSVTEDHVLQVCTQMLEEAKLQYNSRTPSNVSSPQSDVDFASEQRKQQLVTQSSHHPLYKRKDGESDVDNLSKQRKKIMRTVTSVIPGSPTPIKVVKLESVRREGPKWNPNRINRSTLFIMGARANKVLGFGQTRGRLYTKHPDLLKYSGDTEDKEWLSRNNLMPPTGGIAYLLLLEDVRELAESEEYRYNPNVLLHELKGFEAPEFMLVKIINFVANARTDAREDFNFHFCDSLSRCGQPTETTVPTTTMSINQQQLTNYNQEQLLHDNLLLSLSQYHPIQSGLQSLYVSNQSHGTRAELF